MLTEDQALEVAREVLSDGMTEYRDSNGDYSVELVEMTADEVTYNIIDPDDEDVDIIVIFKIELG